MINARLVPDAQAGITPGEAMAGMILNGLGLAHRPLSLTPQFFANKPRALLLREDSRAEMGNRFPRGRTLAEAYAYGCDLLFHELALAVGGQAGIALRFHPLDTTSFSLSGEYGPASEAQAIPITHGYAREHRPDWQQVVLALLVSPDGGVPFMRKRWDGHTSDIAVFQERAQALRAAFTNAPTPRSLSAAAKLYQEDHAPPLQKLGFLPRIPNTLGAGSQVIAPARPWDTGPRLAAQTRSQSIALCHYGLAQRWLVVHAPAALERAEATGTTARQRAEAGIAKPLLHLQAQRFTTPQVAQDALVALAKRWTYPQVAASTLIEHTRYACTGRPTPPSPLKAIAWHSQARVRPAQEGMEPHKQAKAGCVLGPNMSVSAWCDAEVIVASKGQSWVEGGVRFLTAPLFLVSSLLVKKPRRIEGLWMVMPLALLVYAVAQRRLRQP